MLRHAPLPRLLLAASLSTAAFAAPTSDPATHRPRSSDDRGFSIILVSPDDAWLSGRQTIAIEAIIPRGDTIAQVDFFVDGKLVTSDNKPPYATSAEFGAEIRRHDIQARAVTREGRRARVSLVTRSADASDRAAGPVVTLPATVRDQDGNTVDQLTVSDFVLEEEGVRQNIVQFRTGPSPASIAVSVDPALPIAQVRTWLSGFFGALPRHQAVALDAGASSGDPAFSFEPEGLLSSLDSAAQAASGAGLAERVARDASAVESRRGPRLLVVLAAATPVGEEPAGPPAPPDLAPANVAVLGARAGAAAAGARNARAIPAAHTAKPAAGTVSPESDLPEDPMAAALEEARRAAVVHVVAFPASDRLRYDEAAALVRLLQETADRSGGRLVTVSTPEQATSAVRELVDTIRHQYVLAYMPHPGGKPGWRTLKLKVPRDDLTVEAPRAVYMGP
jgi:hypothetical protein